MPSDTSREQKLAAARKKLRDYQSKKAQGEEKKIGTNEQTQKSSEYESKISDGSISEAISSQYVEPSHGFEDAVNPGLLGKDRDSDVSPDSSSVITVVPAQTESDSTIKSTTESLRQLSLQITGLMTDSDDQGPGANIVVAELERRNEELAGLLTNEKQKSLQLFQCNEELKQQLSQKNEEVFVLQQNSAASPQLQIELDAASKELEAHVRTIQMLTTENTRLQTTLNETQKSLSSNAEQMMLLQNNLETSQEHCKYLEAAIAEKQKELELIQNSSDNSSQEINTMSQKNQLLQFQKDELETTVDELKEKLSSKSSENESLTKEISSYASKLELANIHVQQLRDSSTDELTEQMTKLETELGEAKNQITFLNSTIEKTQHDKITLEHQYKAFTNQLSMELDQCKQKIQESDLALGSLRTENGTLLKKLEESEAGKPTAVTEENPQLMNLQIELKKMSEECKKWEEVATQRQHDNGELMKLLNEQRESLEKLESAEDRKNSHQVDTEQLLQSMQSDKIAAARALSQNKQLKEQLEELQNGFIMMSNKKLELTEKLELELHAKKALNKKISELNEKLLSEKVTVVKEEATDDKAVPSDVAISEDKEIKTVESTEETSAVEESSVSEVPSIPNGQNTTEPESTPEKGIEVASVSKEFYDAHEALQVRFKKCMTDLASKIDENQRLEHLVTRLQLETEAVGDYITIYQYRRGVMKKKMQEVKEQLENLQAEKEQMSAKLIKLQTLATKLLPAKESSSSRLISEINTVVNSVEQKSDVKSESVGEQNGVMTNGTTDDSSDQTVEKIRDLINEMEVANQADHSDLKKFHPCHSCSGKLIHV